MKAIDMTERELIGCAVSLILLAVMGAILLVGINVRRAADSLQKIEQAVERAAPPSTSDSESP